MNFKITLNQIGKQYHHKTILHDINLNINVGETLAIIGESGSGKSVLLKTMIGLLEPTAGQVMIDGINLHKMNNQEYATLMHKVGVLFQGNALFDSIKVWENIGFALLQTKYTNKKDIKNIVNHHLNLVGLDDAISNLFPNELSGGMQKRVALARAIIHNPNIIFLDEPTTGLDPINAAHIIKLVQANCQGKNMTTIMITHNINDAYKIANKIAVIHKGEIIWQGKTENILESNNQYVKSLTAFIDK